MNVAKGNNYRLHGKADVRGTRPPKDSTSDKGKIAHEADLMVQRGIQLASYLANCQSAHMSLYMENPVGSLAKRHFMVDWVESGQVRQMEVHYCAYDHCYHKPTNIWTNMKWWEPKGSTGTGKCEEKCKMGHRNSHSEWLEYANIRWNCQPITEDGWFWSAWIRHSISHTEPFRHQ